MGALSPPVRELLQGAPGFPPRLQHLPDPPGRLYARGVLEALDRPVVAVVGSRRGTAYGRRAAEALGRAAASAGWTVLSGMALGVDGAAHRGALDARGATVAVLGSGPDRAYPRAHASLMEDILDSPGGLVLSEHPPGVGPRTHHFPRRNRLLAALAHRVVVVEAAERSGALITARLAAELGREVWAVPGSIFSPVSAGTHALLEDGAVPVTSLEGWRASLSSPDPALQAELHFPDQGVLGPAQPGLPRALWDAVALEPRSPEELALALGRPVPELLPALTSLELDGWLDRGPGPVYFRRAV